MKNKTALEHFTRETVWSELEQKAPTLTPILLGLAPTSMQESEHTVDSLSTSLGMGLSITLKAGVKLPGLLWGAVAQWPEHLELKREGLGSIPGGCPGFFLFQLAY